MIDVLIVEDDAPGAEALAGYIERVPGFSLAGHARSGGDALRRMAAGQVDLVLLDIYLPDITGLEVLRRLRGSGNTVDVMAVTRARDLAVVHAAVSYGVAQYLVKPFTFQGVRTRLERYATYRAKTGQGLLLAQSDIDRLMGGLRAADAGGGLPKQISRESLEAVVAALHAPDESRGVSAIELAQALGTSRVTARRYLEYLFEAGLVAREPRYVEAAGRPELEYTWLTDRHSPADPHARTELR